MDPQRKNRIEFLVKSFCIMGSFFVLGFFIHAEAVTVTISAQVNGSSSGSGGGGGGGGGSTLPSVGSGVRFSGRAYPLSRITILKDGQIVATTIAGQNATFDVLVDNLSATTYLFTVYADDAQNRRSAPFSFPVTITSGVTVNVSGIFISPTIDVDKSQVKQGDNLGIFGQAAPSSEVLISVHSAFESFHRVTTDASGAYLYNLDTSPLEVGGHETKSKTILPTEASAYGKVVPFTVGVTSIPKVTCGKGVGDVNCDGKVNIVDFSIVAFWYQKSSPPSKVDLNRDGKVTLVDLSILAYHWTG
jgi:hypothetical protein